MRIAFAAWAVAVLAALAINARAADGPLQITMPGDVQWTEYPGAPGLQVALLSGDPRRPGPYVMRVRFAPNTMNRPHTHPEDRLVTVISGIWYAGSGNAFEPDQTQAIPPGGVVLQRAGQPHFDGAKSDEVVIQITGVGPTGTSFLRREDDPSPR